VDRNINQAVQTQKPPPPILRQELNLFPAEVDEDGSPAWILHDPLANRHYRLGQLEVDLLMFCGQGDEEKIAQLASIKMGYQITAQQITELITFLRVNNLVQGDGAQIAWYQKQQALSKKSFFTHLAKSYLFFRTPVCHPDHFLDKTLKYVVYLGASLSFLVLGILFFIGIFLVSRQIGSFVGTFLHFFNTIGFAAYLIALVFIKILHELGHAYTAKNMGCKVPVIGIAFLVGWPILYTDTSDAWKLKSRRKRMNIGIAGIAVELAVAIICLFLWSIVADGVVRSVLFLLATTTWMMSILVNFNPLMRFDGYYLLSDWLRMPNLESRSFAMAKWWMREKLFALNALPPEKIKMKFVFYAYAIWVYRFFLFLGIALLVYYFFFKALGLLLFGVEIIYFIVRPVMNELKQWHKFWPQVTWNKSTIRSSLVLFILIALVFIPWRSSIEIPAFIKAEYTTLYAPVSGQLHRIAVRNKQEIHAGGVVVEMYSAQLNYEKQQSQRRYQELSWQRDFLGFDPTMRSQALVINSSLITQNRRLRGLIKKADKQKLLATNAGIVVDSDTEIKEGDWLAEGTPILSILDDKNLIIHAYVEEQYLSRIKLGQKGLFFPENGRYSVLKVELVEIENMAVRTMDALYSASLFGGDVAVREGEDKELLPVISVYKIRLKIVGDQPGLQRVMRGVVVLKANSESIYKRIKNRVVGVFRRESVF